MLYSFGASRLSAQTLHFKACPPTESIHAERSFSITWATIVIIGSRNASSIPQLWAQRLANWDRVGEFRPQLEEWEHVARHDRGPPFHDDDDVVAMMMNT